MMRRTREYLAVGGMPAVVSAFADGNVGRDGKKVTLPHYLAPCLYR